jgi:hypothetical protein
MPTAPARLSTLLGFILRCSFIGTATFFAVVELVSPSKKTKAKTHNPKPKPQTLNPNPHTLDSEP